MEFTSKNILNPKSKNFTHEFFHIGLNSVLADKPYDFSDYPLLEITNPSKKEYYYILKIEDFFLNSKIEDSKHFFEMVDKYYIIKTFYPFSTFF